MNSEILTQLNSDLTALKEDTGWVELVNASDRKVRYRVVRDTVYVMVHANISAPSTWTTIATIPSDYAPSFSNYTVCMYDNETTTQFGNVLIKTNGLIQVQANVPFSGQMCYIL